jgi:predicted nucleic acid-binding protein
MRVFVDTSGFAGAFNKEDGRHPEAIRLWNQFRKDRWSIFTTNYVISETLTLLRVRSGQRIACQFGEAFYASALAQVIRVTEAHDLQAWETFRKYSDQDFSFVDCSSFAVMRDLGISQAFTFDHHFSAMGFERLPE